MLRPSITPSLPAQAKPIDIWFHPIERLVYELAEFFTPPPAGGRESWLPDLRLDAEHEVSYPAPAANEELPVQLAKRGLGCTQDGDCFEEPDAGPCSGVGQPQPIDTDLFDCPDGTTITRARLDELDKKDCSTCEEDDTDCPSTCCNLSSEQNKYSCLCPLDRTGSLCGAVRPWRCRIALIDPELASCPDRVDLPCLSAGPAVTFTYNVQCSQDTQLVANLTEIGEGDPENNYSDGRFEYWTRSGTDFALSRDPNPQVASRIFSFWRLGDATLRSVARLTPQQAIGRENLTYEWNLEEIVKQTVTLTYDKVDYVRPKYVTMGKLYLETGTLTGFLYCLYLIGTTVAMVRPFVSEGGFQFKEVSSLYTTIDGWNMSLYQGRPSPGYVPVTPVDSGLVIVLALCSVFIGALLLSLLKTALRNTGTKQKDL